MENWTLLLRNREKIIKLRGEESRAIEAIELNDLDFQKGISDKKKELAKAGWQG